MRYIVHWYPLATKYWSRIDEIVKFVILTIIKACPSSPETKTSDETKFMPCIPA